MSKSNESLFKEDILTLFLKNNIISLTTIRSLALKHHISNYNALFKILIRKMAISKHFIVQCPICTNELGSSKHFTMDEEIFCPYGEHSFQLTKKNIRLFFHLRS